jgi:GGDEF domain-containing protein
MLDRLRHAVILAEQPVTASVGFAHSGDFDPGTSYETLYKLADVALYRAKSEGRDRVLQAPPADEPTSDASAPPEPAGH